MTPPRYLLVALHALVFVFVASLFLVSCYTDRAAQHINAIVDAYCIAPPAARMALRENIARVVYPNNMTVTCYADTEGLK